MLDNWIRNINANFDLVENNAGPSLVIVVSQSKTDSQYWKDHFLSLRRDVFRKDGKTHVVSVDEGTTKGNFLGMLNAWAHTKRELKEGGLDLPDVALMSMVFGKGTRMSPFTQTMGNRKPALVTPMKATSSEKYLSAADISNLYANTWLQHFRENGFRGLLLKWGDEALIPGQELPSDNADYRNADGIRLAWMTNITETLAREKEWIEIDPQTGLMTFQYSRQDATLLRQRLNALEQDDVCAGVNLGSFAISYEFLDIALEIFEEDILDVSRSVTWDPYVWIALFCSDESQWEAEREIEKRTGLTGIQQLESHFPDFYQKISILRDRLQAQHGRRLAVPTIDFGNLLYIDLGLHWPLRECLNLMTTDSDKGIAIRELFRIHAERDENGNVIINSRVPASAIVRNAVIVDSTVLDEDSVIIQGVVVGGKHKKLTMPNGGIALFCAVDHLEFRDPKGVAYRTIGHDVAISEGERRTTLLTPEGMQDMVSNESVKDYSGPNYTQPILGNKFSFREAGEQMSQIEAKELEALWKFWLK